MREGGLISLYALENVATPGFMPSEKLVFKTRYYFARVTTGVTRRYAALGANRDYSAVIRCFNAVVDESIKYAIDEDGTQYRIDVAEPMHDLDAVDLTLVRLGDFYDIAE